MCYIVIKYFIDSPVSYFSVKKLNYIVIRQEINAEPFFRTIKNMTDFWKIVLGSRKCKKYVDGGSSEFLWHCSRDSEIIKFSILEVSLSLTSCRRNPPIYQQNDGFLEN